MKLDPYLSAQKTHLSIRPDTRKCYRKKLGSTLLQVMAFCIATGKKFLSKTQIQEEIDQRSAKKTGKCKST